VLLWVTVHPVEGDPTLAHELG